jgi:citrate lyase gamma subunit
MPDKEEEGPVLFNDLRDKSKLAMGFAGGIKGQELTPAKEEPKKEEDEFDAGTAVKELKTLSKRFADTQQYVSVLEGENKVFRDRLSNLEGRMDQKPPEVKTVTEQDVEAAVTKKFGKQIRDAVHEMREASDDGLADLDDARIKAAIMQGAEFQDRVSEIREELNEKAAAESKTEKPSGADKKTLDPVLDARLAVMEKALAQIAGKSEIDSIDDPDFDVEDPETLSVIKPLVDNGVPLRQAYDVWKAQRIISGDDDGEVTPTAQPKKVRKSPSRSKTQRGGARGKRLTADEAELKRVDDLIRTRVGVPKSIWDAL